MAHELSMVSIREPSVPKATVFDTQVLARGYCHAADAISCARDKPVIARYAVRNEGGPV